MNGRNKKMLKEDIKKQIKEDIKNKKNTSSKLTTRWKRLLENQDMGQIKKTDYSVLSVMLENQHKWAVTEGRRKGMAQLTEANIQDNQSVQPYLKILVPILRRAYRLMSALELVGNQPLSAPQGYIYALRFMYAGDNELGLDHPTNLDRTMGSELEFKSYALTFGFAPESTESPKTSANTGGTFANINYKNENTYLIYGDSAEPDTLIAVGENLATIKAKTDVTVHGKVQYAESNLSGDLEGGVNNVSTDTNAKVAINREVTGDSLEPTIEPTMDLSGNKRLYLCNFDKTSGLLTVKKEINNIYMSNHNEMGFDFIFKHYTGGMTTNDAEYLGSSVGGQYKTLKMTIERKNVETKSRKLRIEYSDEMYEDLKSMHGLNAAEELTKMAEIEVANEINAMILQAIYQTATVVKGWSYGQAGIIQQDSASHPATTTLSVADGLKQNEKFETLATKIRHESNQIAKQTRRGAGNYIVCTVDVLTALQSTSMFSPAGGDDLLVGGLSYAGMLGKIKVYVDTYNVISGNFCLVGYKGANNHMDAGIIYSAYIPLQVKKAVDPNTFHECIGFRTRTAITTNLFGAHRYYRMFSVDLIGSMVSN